MTYSELVTGLKNVPPQELRVSEDDYFEGVFLQASMPTASVGLEAYFGVPLKPLGMSAGPEAEKISKPYGGIQTGQTLYVRKGQEGLDCALIWPWGNGVSVTLKIIRE
ncbi:MAG: hypothetical protein HQL21_08635 [Candidatus Omnitrophica bacterium]|nr:hypothetical protein [Candidatus Omnitrophota bacterium]